MSYREQVLEAVQAIPAMPAWATQVLQLLRDPDYDIRDLLTILEYDPGLTTNILRLANSAYFAGPNPTNTVRDAVVLLGTKRIFQLVLMNAISPMTRRPLHGYGLTEGQLLQHSIATAVAAEQLCLQLKRPAADIAFTGGLVHDLGKLVLGSFVELAAGPIIRAATEDGLPFEEAERLVLGIDHAEAGATLLQAWHLPEEIVRVVRYHHAPQDVDEHSDAIDAVHLADVISRRNGLGIAREGAHYHIARKSLERLKLTQEIRETVTATMVAALQEILGALQMRSFNYRAN